MKQVKFLAVALGLVIASTFSANAQKIGAVNFDALIANLPEFQKTQQAYQKWQEDSVGSQYTKLYAELQEKDSLLKKETNPSVKQLLEKRVGEIQGILANWQQYVGPTVQQKQEEFFSPLYKKVNDAINAYAKEKAYSYVLTRDAFIVIPQADDLSIPIAQRLGIKVDAQGNAPGATVPQK